MNILIKNKNKKYIFLSKRKTSCEYFNTVDHVAFKIENRDGLGQTRSPRLIS